jgi:hypothetical protein
MHRKIRRVHRDWLHLENKPLREGYSEDVDIFLEKVEVDGLQEAIDSCGVPSIHHYMPEWEEEEKTHIMMYTSSGTSISPAFETPEELARWLTDTNASAYALSTNTYEQWLKFCYPT